MIKIEDPYWYRKCWTLDIKHESWVEDTVNQVDFIIKALELKGNERILDLACGFGRHSLEFAKRGFSVTGVDITREYVDDAIKSASELSLEVEFIQADIRDITYNNEFDVVLNLADGAIGYLENEDENLKIFDAVAKALKPGGKHFMDICRAEHAENFFPKRHWEVGEESLALADFDWDAKTRSMLFHGYTVAFGKIAEKFEVQDSAGGYRLYSLDEVREILKNRGMEITGTYSDYYGSPETFKQLQLMVCSQKK